MWNFVIINVRYGAGYIYVEIIKRNTNYYYMCLVISIYQHNMNTCTPEVFAINYNVRRFHQLRFGWLIFNAVIFLHMIFSFITFHVGCLSQIFFTKCTETVITIDSSIYSWLKIIKLSLLVKIYSVFCWLEYRYRALRQICAYPKIFNSQIF